MMVSPMTKRMPPRTCMRVAGLGKMKKDRKRVRALRAVVVIVEAKAPNFLVSAATHVTPK